MSAPVLPARRTSLMQRRSLSWPWLRSAAREFAPSWTGGGVDESLVDPEQLAATWRSDGLNPRSLLLLQAVWLHGRS